MHFAFSDEQLAFRDATRDLLANECTPAHVRDAWTNETGRVPGLWEQLADMGVIGMLAPESAGGLGLTFVDLVLVLEETGRFAVPEPIVETAAWGVPLLGRTDLTVAAGEYWVPWADTADVIFTAAGRFERADVELVPRPSVDGARRLFEVQGTPGARRRRRSARRLRPRRVRNRRAAMRVGRSHAGDDRRLRAGAPAVRRPGRLVPGGEAPPRRRPHRARVRPPARVPGRGVDRDRRPRHRRARVDGQGQGRRRRAASPPAPRSSATARSATRPSTTCTST